MKSIITKEAVAEALNINYEGEDILEGRRKGWGKPNELSYQYWIVKNREEFMTIQSCLSEKGFNSVTVRNQIIDCLNYIMLQRAFGAKNGKIYRVNTLINKGIEIEVLPLILLLSRKFLLRKKVFFPGINTREIIQNARNHAVVDLVVKRCFVFSYDGIPCRLLDNDYNSKKVLINDGYNDKIISKLTAVSVL